MSETPLMPQEPGAPQEPQGKGKAIASLVLGIIGLLGWCLPIVGLPVTIIRLVLGIKALPTPSRGMAIAGIVLCILGLVASIVNAIIGAYLGATGAL
ncbi:MAG: DUF4190 domain-containing protein [Planctomycetota bacterium]|jgi:hypothetical protein